MLILYMNYKVSTVQISMKEGSFARTDQSILRVFDIMLSETMIKIINKGINVPKKEEQ